MAERMNIMVDIKEDIKEELYNKIVEKVDYVSWENITALYNRDGEAWELRKFEETVEFDGEEYFVVIIEKWNLNPDDISEVEDVEVVFEKYICL